MNRLRNSTMGCVGVWHSVKTLCAAASVLPPPTRFMRRSAAGRGTSNVAADRSCSWSGTAGRCPRCCSRHNKSRSPAGAHRKKNVNITGMNIIIFCCAGSLPAGVGVIRCIQSWLDAHEHRRDEQRIRHRQIVNPEDERRAAQLDRFREQRVKRIQHREA